MPDAQWINGTGSQADYPAGGFDYVTSFTLTGYDLSTAHLTLVFTVDNWAQVFLNGTAITNPGVGTLGVTTTATYSGTLFQPGANEVVVRVHNGARGGDRFGPTGLSARLTVEAVPEPASMTALGLGLAALRRRRK